jgi:phospholipid transport system substrate-binding protein
MNKLLNAPSFNRRHLLGTAVAAALTTWVATAQAADEAPEAFIKRITNETLDTIKGDKALRNGDMVKIMQLVDGKLMQHVKFKVLLVRTYAGALSQITDQVVVVKPLRAGQDDKNLVVNTEVRGKGEPIQLDYRLEKSGDGWMIFDLNVLGVWLVENYRTQFTKEINSGGIDALIASLVARNKSNAGKS